MTKQELNRHLKLLQQLEKERELLASLESADIADEAASIREDITNLDTEIQRSEAGVLDWISAIEDIPTRMIFRLRFLRGLDWKTVTALICEGNTASSVRNRVVRYLEAHHDE